MKKYLKERQIFGQDQPNHYNSIDGLRALSCLGIVMMHIQANTRYNLA